MLNETRLEGLSLSAVENAVLALIDTQVVLQLLVSKGIVTREEVSITRKIVTNQPKYKNILESIDNVNAKINDNAKLEELMEKSLRPGGREHLADEERKYIIDRLTAISNSSKK